MALEATVNKRYVVSSAPQAVFSDGTHLVITADTGRYGAIEGLYSAGLYKSKRLEAGVVGGERFAQKGFWTAGRVTQTELADYMKLAIEGAESGSDFKRRCSRIDSWLQLLEEEKAEILAEKPRGAFYDSPPY